MKVWKEVGSCSCSYSFILGFKNLERNVSGDKRGEGGSEMEC
jgi:hypothetical protein